MPKISLRIPADLSAQIRALASDLCTTESEVCRLLLNRGLGVAAGDQLSESLAQAHALIRALASEISLMSAFVEEFAARNIPAEKRDEYRAAIRRRKVVAEKEIQELAARYLEEIA